MGLRVIKGLYKIYNRKVRISPPQRLQRLPARYSKQKIYKFKRVSVQWTMVRDTRQFLSLNSSFSCIDYIDIVPVYSSYAHMNKQDAINSAKKRGLGKGGGVGEGAYQIFFSGI